MNLKNAIVDSIRTNKDGSVKITLVTRELSPEQMAELFISVNKEVLSIDIPEDTTDTKTNSQRLRAVLYKNWELQKDRFDSFALYYDHTMEKIIDHYKSKL
jgi:hypothetical protein